MNIMSIVKCFKIPLLVLNDILKFFITYFPGPTGRKIRYYYWRGKFRKCGKNVLIDEGVIIQGPEYISIGDNVWIDKYSILMAGPVK
jgi:acetyltransferase-like isoleucine patch superfamily enzyme